MSTLTTARLTLAPFRDEHLPGLHAMNADPAVMRYLSGRAETLEETKAMVERVKLRWQTVGHSWWSFIDTHSGAVIGAGAIQHLRREATAEPDLGCPLEIGWRLRQDHWGQGLATEAARAMAAFAFEQLQAPTLLAVCDPDNLASAAVMQRLGMQDCGLQRWYGRTLSTYQVHAPGPQPA